MSLANVDEMAKDNSGVKYLQVRQNSFDRTVDAKGMKKNTPKKPFVYFNYDYNKKNQKQMGRRGNSN